MQGSLQAKAISTGVEPAVASYFRTGVVHSVFQRATNFLFDGRLLTVCHEDLGIPPNGITVATSISFFRFGLESKQRVYLGDGCLTVPDAGLQIDLSLAASWPSFLVQASSAINSSRRKENVSAAWDALHAWEDASVAEFWNSQTDPVSRLVASVRAKNLQGAHAEVAKLVGLGAGLTPAGDDFLLGFVAALWVEGDPIAGPLANLVATIANGKTTLVAATFHEYAARHFYGNALHMLLQSILMDTIQESERVVKKTLAIGATSGGDTLRGVLVALGR